LSITEVGDFETLTYPPTKTLNSERNNQTGTRPQFWLYCVIGRFYLKIMELNSELDRLQKYAPIDEELKRAEKKHPNFPKDMYQQLAIVQEEAGEVTKAVLHYHYEGGRLQDVKDELIQTAAMCMRMLNAL
jgi:NTP pyrophosphatase (non-canonical NTP hydrolase)